MKIFKLIIASVGVCMMTMTSCKTPENITYFQNPEQVIEIVSTQSAIKLQPGDKLTVIVKSKDPQVSDLFNMPVYTQRLGTASATSSASGAISQPYRMATSEGLATYTVSPQGTIDFPILGEIKVEGMTRPELAAFVKGELIGRDLVKDPSVVVEFLNTGVNILGSVNHPGRYEINTDTYTILDAIAVAGDLNIGGQRENVKVIREENGSLKVYTVDLTDLKKASSSPAFYLHQNDVVYVEPNEMVKRSSTVNGNNALSTSFWISVASLITTAVTTVGVFVRK